MVKHEATVATENSSFITMKEEGQWDLLDTLRKGSVAMRAEGTKFLPKQKAEASDQYTARKNRTFLFMAYSDALDTIASGPFSRELAFLEEEKLPEMLAQIKKDADGANTSLSDFALNLFDDSLQYGLSHFLVDVPGDISSLSLGEQRKLSLHPYFVHIPASSMFAWRTERVGGQEKLVHARWLETSEQSSGEWGSVSVTQIREFNAPVGDEQGIWRVWRQTEEKKEWVQVDEGFHSFPGVPIITMYTKRRSFMDARPPFLKLGELNLEHWQKSSDLNNSQHYALVPTLVKTGVEDTDDAPATVIGAQEAIDLPNKDSKIEWLEVKGTALKLGAENLDTIEMRMAKLAAEPFMRRVGPETATGRSIDNAKLHSIVQTWVRRLEAALWDGYNHAAVYVGEALPEGFSVNAFTSGQSPVTNSGDNVRTLESARARRDIDHQTWVEEMQRHGVLDEMVSSETISGRLEDEADAEFADAKKKDKLPKLVDEPLED